MPEERKACHYKATVLHERLGKVADRPNAVPIRHLCMRVFCRLQYQAGCSELQRQNILHLLNVNFQLLLKIDFHLVGCRNHAYALESKDARGDHLSLLQRERATATEAVCTVRQGRDRALVSAGQGNNIYDTTKGSKSTAEESASRVRPSDRLFLYAARI